MVYRFASLIGLICSIASATGITPHEQIVRKAYAKLAFATQTAAVQKWTVERRTPASNNDYGALISFVAEQKASFAISNFKTGSVKQPLPEHGTVNAIVTRPSGQVLRMAFATTTYKTASGPVALVSVQPRWATLPYLAQDWDIPFTKAVQDFDPAGLYTSYASFDVTVTCRQVSRTYAAAFLFAEGPDGIRAVEPLDYIVGGTVLKQVSDAAISPMPLLVSAIPSQEFFRWFVSVTPGSRGCADLGDGLCCDWDNLQCGFTEDAVAKAAETTAVIVPLEPVNSCSEYNAWAPPISSSDSNDQQHVWGDHGASVTFRSACTYTDVSQPGPGQPCWTDCSVTPDGRSEERRVG